MADMGRLTMVVLPFLCAILGLAVSERLVFSDEFDFLNPYKWTHVVTTDKGREKEFQYYRNNRNNSFVKSGILYIKPTLTADEYGENYLYNGYLDLSREACNKFPCNAVAGAEILSPIQSAQIRTINSFKFARIEIRAKLPRGDWLWPSISLEPTRNEYGPYPLSGDIKIVESRGNRKLSNFQGSKGSDAVSSSLHFGPSAEKDAWQKALYEKRLWNGQDFASDFHIFSIDWKPYGIKFLVDGQTVGSFQPPFIGGFWRYGGFTGANPWIRGSNMAPFDKDFNLVVKLAVGGTGKFPDTLKSSPRKKPWDDRSPNPMREFWERRHWWYPSWSPYTDDASLQIDYIRVYQN